MAGEVVVTWAGWLELFDIRAKLASLGTDDRSNQHRSLITQVTVHL